MMGSRKVYIANDRREAVCSGLGVDGFYERNLSGCKELVYKLNPHTLGSKGIYRRGIVRGTMTAAKTSNERFRTAP